MKPAAFVFLLFCITACKKERSNFQKLQGRWELKTSYNGFTGSATHHPKGNGKLLVFSHTTKYYFENAQLILQKDFRFRDTTWTGQTGFALVVEPPHVTEFCRIEDSLLHISPMGTSDGGGATYRRK